MKEGFPEKRGQYKGKGFLSLSREVMLRPRNLNDPNGFYKLIEVEPWASDEEIHRGYRKMSKLYHPDGSIPNKEKFLLISQAYRVLTNYREEYNSLPEGVRWRFEGEEASGGLSLADLSSESCSESKGEGFSYYYTQGEHGELAEAWYEALLEELPRWGYRGRVSLKLGEEIEAGGRRIEVPYEYPTPVLLFLVSLSAVSSRRKRFA